MITTLFDTYKILGFKNLQNALNPKIESFY
jgi:hypothetical protein